MSYLAIGKLPSANLASGMFASGTSVSAKIHEGLQTAGHQIVSDVKRVTGRTRDTGAQQSWGDAVAPVKEAMDRMRLRGQAERVNEVSALDSLVGLFMSGDISLWQDIGNTAKTIATAHPSFAADYDILNRVSREVKDKVIAQQLKDVPTPASPGVVERISQAFPGYNPMSATGSAGPSKVLIAGGVGVAALVGYLLWQKKKAG